MLNTGVVVSVVDDDESVRESLPDLLQEFGYSSRVFSSAEEFLRSGEVKSTNCIVLDVAMPGMSGPDLLLELGRLRVSVPIVFITAHSDEGVRPRMLKMGAVDCLMKPFSDIALMRAIDVALRRPGGK